MANALETTFKNLQSDERYKKLERTLKMALLKNAERRSTDNGNAGTWPNVSSINGDHLDTSLAAMSIQSSRIGSEVVSSSTNLRNILLHKQHFHGPGNNVATSSENQFPTNKDNDDSAMMPPPRTPGVGFGRSKRFSGENQRLPLINMPVNSGRNTNGFSMSTPASSISSIPKCVGPVSVNSSTVFQENNNYHGRSGYGEANSGSQKQERNFSRWKVLLNDKGQLIIKGTLECGKVARSKPVIRRLSPTSVQSIFKHTYHLQGNLVDDRGELPDYVRGKFYNGFPDDWENVYQVWRNFVNDGNRLSFRWPTAVTDSDDDIKSGITEITYRPERYKKRVSPRKRNRSAKNTSLNLSVEDSENRPNSNTCSCSHASGGTPLEKPDRDNHTEFENLPQTNSKSNRLKDRKVDVTLDENQKSHECTATSLNTMDNSSVNPLAGYIPEDKLNIIIENLTDKNCPIEYIHKIVQMFDCMKYVVSYQSTVDNESEKGSVSHTKQASQTPMKNNRSTEEKSDLPIDRANTSNSKNRVNTPRPSIPKANQYDNQLTTGSAGSSTSEKSYKDRNRQTRKQLTKHDYASSESDNDFYDDEQKTSSHRLPASNERLRNTQKYKIPPVLVASRTKYVESETLSEAPRVSHTEIPAARTQTHDSSLSDEEFVVERKRETKLGNKRIFISPRKIRGASEKENRSEHYDSSISITEDEERFTDKPKVKEMRKENYDSSVSITEDEHTDGRNRNTRAYYVESNARPLESEIRRNGNPRDDRKRLNDLNYYPETKSRPIEQSLTRSGDNRGARKRLDSLDYYPESNSRHAEQSANRDVDRNGRRRLDSLDYYSDTRSHPIEQNISRTGNIPDDRRLDSLKFHGELNSRSDEQDMKNSPLRNLRVTRKTYASQMADNDHYDSVNTPNPTVKSYGSTAGSNVNYHANEQENDSAYLSSDIKRMKKINGNRELTEIESSKSCDNTRSSQQDFQQSPESPEMPPTKSKTPQIRKKPTVINAEIVDINLTAHDWQKVNGGKENDKNAGHSPRRNVDGSKGHPTSNAAKNDTIGQKSSVDIAEPTKIAEPLKPNTRSKDGNGALKAKDSKSSTKENKIENAENSKDSSVNNAPIGEYGSEGNPKLLTAWVPAVILDDDGDKKCNLIFEGKLLNEAGHVANRKFVTDIIRRRLSPKIIETISHEFYKLVGDLNDTKHVVPKELIKLCYNGCPGKIGNFCERWKSLTGEIYKSPPQEHLHNTSVDCLSVPMSSRGRRILPPLNYWDGERVVIKDNKTIYNPGNSQECSIPSSSENTTLEVRNKANSPKARSETKRTSESRANEIKKRDMDKITPPSNSKSNVESPPQSARGSQKTRAGKRRLTKNVQASSSESDDGVETKPTPRKRKQRANDKVMNTDNVSTRKLRNSEKNVSPQDLENATISPKKGSFVKPSDPEVKVKLKKRQKIDDNQGTLQQFVTRRPPEVICTYYKNVPMHDGDLSEDQLSTM